MHNARFIYPSVLLTLAAFGLLWLLAPSWRRWSVALGFWGLAGLGQVGWVLAKLRLLGPLTSAAQTVGAGWLAAVSIVCAVGVPLLVARELARGLRLLGGRTPRPLDPARRRLLEAALPVGALAMGAGGSVSLRPFELRREEVRIRGLPRALDGFRIGQLSDVHVGPFIDAEHLRRAVDALDAEGVDLQVLTGDLIDDMSQLEATFAAMESCKARHGMLAVLGNHEKWRGLRAVLAAYGRAAPRGRVRLLVDESVRLEHAGAALRVVGVDYPMPRRRPLQSREALMEASAQRAFAGVQPGEALLCLSHDPDFFRLAAARGAHLTLSGHTHGGQIGLFRVPLLRFVYAYILGRYRRGEAHLYVSAGTGHWFPLRIGIPTEVTVLTLRSA